MGMADACHLVIAGPQGRWGPNKNALLGNVGSLMRLAWGQFPSLSPVVMVRRWKKAAGDRDDLS